MTQLQERDRKRAAVTEWCVRQGWNVVPREHLDFAENFWRWDLTRSDDRTALNISRQVLDENSVGQLVHALEQLSVKPSLEATPGEFAFLITRATAQQKKEWWPLIEKDFGDVVLIVAKDGDVFPRSA
jgi:hypothetical protein